MSFQPNPLSPMSVGQQIMATQHPLYKPPMQIDNTITARNTIGEPIRDSTYLRDTAGSPIQPGEFSYAKVRDINVNGQFNTTPISDLGKIIDSEPVSRPLTLGELPMTPERRNAIAELKKQYPHLYPPHKF